MTLAWPRLALISLQVQQDGKGTFSPGLNEAACVSTSFTDSNKINEHSHLGGALNVTLKLIFKHS